jgi:hypothetical protein
MWCFSILTRTTLAAVVTALSVGYANAQQFQAAFSGFNEVPPIRSPGHATLKMTLNTQLQSLTYTLTYSQLSATTTQAHIQFARARDNGGVFVFLCTNLGNGPAGTPACPNPSGTVSGTLTPASVVGPAAQFIAAGDFNGLADALVAQATYANIHTTNFPAGEIRGEIVQCPPNGCP